MNENNVEESPSKSKLACQRALVVLGPFRGGTSVTCGVLHHLGVFVGKQFWDAKSKYCTYEAFGLRTSCNACFDERPNRWKHQGTYQQRIAQLKHWITYARSQAVELGCVGVGGKHPTLCKLIDETAVAWHTTGGIPPLFISVVRPIEDVLRSWEKATDIRGAPWWRRSDREQIVEDLITSRDDALQRHEHICFDFASLKSDPIRTIRKLAVNCNLPTTKLDSAVQLVHRSN